MKWSMKRFTFVIIPDANGSVKRFALPRLIFIAVPALFAFLALVACGLFLLYARNLSDVGDMRRELSESASRYERQLADKNDSIESLQTQVAGLSEQTKSIQQKVDEVNQLENQVKGMVGLQEADSSKGGAKDLTTYGGTVEDGDPSDGGMGGEDLPVTNEEINALARNTADQLLTLAPVLDELANRLKQTKTDVDQARKRLRITPTIWPTDNRRITSLFGVRTDPFTGKARFHAGLDIAGHVGDPIFAAADGVVALSEKDSAEGNNIIIDHGNGIRTWYMHMSKLIATVGQKVAKGEQIGELGSTGRSTGPHLHYEVLVAGEPVDPRAYLKADRKASE
ncbi:M23 family metallopeptidase [Cohnella zeiphila]|uniref:M23 family metallopeptidase n=1 Tax=Cohnella zeiphila TaxID=2761120 RepID=A0A7X0SU92_9BACL|nr:M23 family metallopeptidase [Cohnella zeiphila]MBB6735015.1 M23 family metallopeptidase [Cohnella zeiphila]